MFCAVTGKKVDDLISWYTRQKTQEETEREKGKVSFRAYNEQWMYRSPQTGQKYCGTFTQRSQRIAKGSGRNGVLEKMQTE